MKRPSNLLIFIDNCVKLDLWDWSRHKKDAMGCTKINKNYIFIALIFIFACGIRFYNPTFRSLWGDESHSFYLARAIANSWQPSSMLSPIRDGHQPLYFILLAFWIRLFGSGALALRSLSIVIGCSSITTIYYFTKRIFETRTALFASFLLAISPLAIMHSHEIRMYGLVLLLSILASDRLYRLLHGEKRKLNYVLLFIFNILLLLTHVYTSLLIISQLLYLLIRWRKQSEPMIAGVILLAGCAAFPFYLPLLISGLGVAVSGSGDMAFAVFPWPLKIALIFFVFLLGETVAPWNLPVVLPTIIATCFIFFSVWRDRHDEKIIFLLTLAIFPIAIAGIFLRPTMPKYLIFTLPFYLIILAHALSTIKVTWLKWTVVLIISIAQFASIANYFSLKDYHNSNQIEPWRQVATQIENNFKEGDSIIVTNYYIVKNILNYYINIVDKRNIKIVSMELETIDSSSLNYRRIWLISHIIDDKKFTHGELEHLKSMINNKYKLLSEIKYVPYEDTLVSKLPINRHRTGSSRINLSLYLKR